MPTINENVLSEINCLPNTTDEMKSFLKWILGYERDHAEQRAFYKVDIEKKLDQTLIINKANN